MFHTYIKVPFCILILVTALTIVSAHHITTEQDNAITHLTWLLSLLSPLNLEIIMRAMLLHVYCTF